MADDPRQQGHPGSIPYDDATPGELAQIDQNIADANHWLDHLIDAYREHRRDCPHPPVVCPGEQFIDMMLGFRHENWAQLLGVAVHRLAEASRG